MPTGQIVSICAQKGFGFIRPDEGGPDLFFHHSTIKQSLHELAEGQTVAFQIDANAKKPRAASVSVTGGVRKPQGKTPNRGVRKREGRGDRKSPGDRREKNFGRGARPERGAKPVRGPKLERGYVTKLLWKTRQGFISSDKGGAEFLFSEADVSGDKPFAKLAIGDYVQFARTGKVERTKIDKAPTASHVEVVEKEVKLPPLKELPKNPRARRKKPTWRR